MGIIASVLANISGNEQYFSQKNCEKTEIVLSLVANLMSQEEIN